MSTDMTSDTAEESTLLMARIYTSKVIHIIDLNAPRLPEQPPERAPSLCSLRPVWPGIWIQDNEGAKVCGRCTSAKEASERVR